MARRRVRMSSAVCAALRDHALLCSDAMMCLRTTRSLRVCTQMHQGHALLVPYTWQLKYGRVAGADWHGVDQARPARLARIRQKAYAV